MPDNLGIILLTVVGVAIAFFWWLISREVGVMRRRDANQCLHCGYSLTGTPDRCPECGATVEYDSCVTGELDADRLRDEWPEHAIEARTPDPWELFQVVHSAADPREADLLVEQLSARGWVARSAMVESPGIAGYSMPQRFFRVEVCETDLKAAGEYIKSLRRSVRLARDPSAPRQEAE